MPKSIKITFSIRAMSIFLCFVTTLGCQESVKTTQKHEAKSDSIKDLTKIRPFDSSFSEPSKYTNKKQLGEIQREFNQKKVKQFNKLLEKINLTS